jgi:DNA-binding transcriptional LysR family regulator
LSDLGVGRADAKHPLAASRPASSDRQNHAPITIALDIVRGLGYLGAFDVQISTSAMNWDDLRFFLELARLKRLNQAGRKLGVDHTTVARRIDQLEAALGCRLFESMVDGYVLTEAGQRLMAHAETIENNIGLLREEALGQSVRVSGSVRIGTPEGFGTVFLTPRLGRLVGDHPDLNVELLTLPRFPSLAAREADIIVTLDPPQHGRYIASRLTDFTYGLFASRAYLKQHAPVRAKAQLAEHNLIGYIDELLPSPQLHYLDELVPQHRLRVSSSGMLAQVAAVRAGLGLGVLAHFLAAGTGLVPLLPKEAVWKRTFWLATHADWYRLRRVRAVWDFVRRAVEAETALFVAKVMRDATAARERPAAPSVSTAARVANAVRNSKKRSVT